MRWSRSVRVRTAARRGAGLALIVLGFGFVLVLGWSGASPREVVPPEGGGQAWQVNTAGGVANERLDRSGEDPGEAAAGREPGVGRRGATADLTASEAKPAQQAAPKPINPIDELVDGPGFSRFIGFTAISVGVAVVVLVFFWSHRRNPYA